MPRATTALRATFLTLFPESLGPILQSSILGRGQKAGLLAVDTVDLRDFSTNKHRTVDDSPAGGGPGMILRVDVVAGALTALRARDPAVHVVAVDARGAPFAQRDARRLSQHAHVAFVCGRYEGIDARAFELVDEVLSLGDFVLTGGELPALAMFDAAARLVPGVLGNDASTTSESFSAVVLEERQYTRPVVFRGRAVPPVLLSGNHQDIAKARRKDSLTLTAKLRPDLFCARDKSKADDKLLVDERVPTLAPVASSGDDEDGT
ncbi:MAG: tRNA (guanosine(37)-N1)-methyltransferase TrmD [Deltaproteobacteria bacterium]|nr:tRNA (guanosine(37)-N1)-methyltransferase TrmD [Deltaproteobacteria bacterium]